MPDPEPPPDVDPRVCAAFALGWQMAELYRPELRHSHAPANPHDLPGLGAFDTAQQRALGVAQIQAALCRLREPIEHAGLTLPDFAAARKMLVDGADDAARHATLVDLHVQLMTALAAVDFRLGKAYGLGRALADTCRGPRDLDTLRKELAPYRVAMLGAWIADLSSALPPHAGHAVKTTLERWRDWALTTSEADAGPDTWRLLRRQGELWRALLSAEKLGADMLEPRNFLDAADRMVKQMRSLMLSSLQRFPGVLALVVVLFLGGVALMLAVGSRASIAAGLGGIVASLGLSWKGLGRELTTLLAKLEQPLWGAELDAAVAAAITLVPDGASAANAQHRDVALAAGGANRVA